MPSTRPQAPRFFTAARLAIADLHGTAGALETLLPARNSRCIGNNAACCATDAFARGGEAQICLSARYAATSRPRSIVLKADHVRGREFGWSVLKYCTRGREHRVVSAEVLHADSVQGQPPDVENHGLSLERVDLLDYLVLVSRGVAACLQQLA